MSDGTTVLMRDQGRRWAAGERVPVEDYLRERPALREDDDALLKLIFHEMVLRREAGEAPGLDEYRKRFPKVAGELAPFFDILREVVPPPGEKTLPQEGPPSSAGQSFPHVPGYAVVAKLGHGGMGVVYKARQLKAGRFVALKVLRAGAHAGGPELARFTAEIEAAAKLSHPNVVPIYEVGGHDDLPYFTMEFVDGPTLSRHLAGEPQPPRAAAALVETLARAMHYAHGQGVVHRDLKPANVLLSLALCPPPLAEDEGRGTKDKGHVPKIADFGLAKCLGASARQTGSGAILGTPEYMAPEQAGGAETAGPPADVYALGAILYECLTGRPPFRGPDAVATLLQVRTLDPVPPLRLQPTCPPDLDTICLKCLEKGPRERYRSAEELADDLRRFLDGKPTLARPLRWWARAAKYARRHPARAALVGVTTLTAALIVAGAGYEVYRQEFVERLGQQIDFFQHRANEEEARATSATALADGETKRADTATRRADGKEREAAQAGYYFAIRKGHTAHFGGHFAEARAWLESQRPGPGETDRRDFEWYHLYRLCHPEERTLSCPVKGALCAALSADGRAVAYGGLGGLCVRDGDAAAESRPLRRPPLALAFSPDARLLALAYDDRYVGILDWRTGKEALLAPPAPERGEERPPSLLIKANNLEAIEGGMHHGHVRIAWSSGGGALAVAGLAGDRVAHVCRVPPPEQGRPAPTWLALRGHTGGVHALAFAPDGGLLATGGAGGAIRLWRPTTGAFLTTQTAPGGDVRGLWFSPDATTLAAAGADQSVRLWTLTGDKGRPVLTEKGPARAGHQGSLVAAALVPDGRLVTCDDEALRVWGADGALRQLVPHGHDGAAGALTFRRTDGRLASAGLHGTVKVWNVDDLDNPRELAPQPGRSGPAGGRPCLAFSPDGKRLATGAGNAVYLYDVTAGKGQMLTGHPKVVNALAFAPGGKTLASGSADGTVRLWDGAGKELPPLPDEHNGAVTALAFSPDGTTLATAGRDMSFVLRDVEKRRTTGRARLKREGWALAFSPDGTTLAVGTRAFGARPPSGEIQLYDLVTRKETASLKGHVHTVTALAFSPDGGTLVSATGAPDGDVLVWDVKEKRSARLPQKHPSPVWALAYSRDGRTLATAGTELTLWNVAGWDERFGFAAPRGGFRAAAFSADGEWLAARAGDGSVRLWRAATDDGARRRRER